MSTRIHPMAAVDPKAELGEGVIVGPFCVVEAGARIGAGTVLRSHVVVSSFAEVGEGNDIFPHATLGLEPQDLKFRGEESRFILGDRNVVRESATLHRGTADGGGITRVGSDNLFMTGAHVAHDCQVGDRNIFANCATLAGHVEVGQGCTIGAFSAIHQFCRVGDHAFIGGFTVATMDVLPFMKTVGTRETKSYGVNVLGLKRKDFTDETIEALKKAHKILFDSGLLREEALAKAEVELGQYAEVAYLLRFMREAKRGVHRG